MSFCCSQCSFTAQFESALTMHKQLHHGSAVGWDIKRMMGKSNTVPRAACQERQLPSKDNKESKCKLGRTTSATKLLGKLRARICRSKTLFVHPEEGASQLNVLDLKSPNVCSSKASPSCSPDLDIRVAKKEIYACHLCSFDADRITVLDRHLLNDHKIGLENLLKLVMHKTKDGLSEDTAVSNIYGLRQPYYKCPDNIIDDGEFIIETVTPKIKILKHAAVNTDLKGVDMLNLKDNQNIGDDNADELTALKSDDDKLDLFEKMKTLNECMCKFVDSSDVLKKVLTKEFVQKTSGRSERQSEKAIFDLGLGDQDAPRNWERPHSEKLERNRSKYGENRSGSEKLIMPSDSFYF